MSVTIFDDARGGPIMVEADDPALIPASAARPDSVPSITDRQFGEGLWRDGLIPFEDYLAFVGPGTIPSRLMAVVNRLPDDDTGAPTPRKVALGLVTGAQVYEFGKPLVEIVRQDFERENPTWTPAHLRERWLVWATL